MNLYAYGYRHYDPAIARWTTMDPLLNDLKFSFDDKDVDKDDEDDVYQALVTKLETGNGIFNTDNLNPYGYGYNNPISFDDPDGRCPICLLVVAALLVSQSAEAPTGNYKMDTQSRNATAGNNTLIPGLIAGGATGNIITNAYKANSIRNTIEKSKEKTYQTYTKDNKKTGETYTGRTSGKDTPRKNVAKRDSNHHKNKEGFGPAKLDKSSKNKDAIRGREQQLIDKNGKAKSEGGTSGNSIRGVSTKNPKAKTYEAAAKKEFGD